MSGKQTYNPIDTTKDISSKFLNYKAFENNFEPLYIIKLGSDYVVFKRTAETYNDYIYSADTIDNIEGWLYGAVQAVNNVFSKNSNEPVLESISFNNLPEYCYVYIITDKIIGIIKKGIEGYYTSDIEITPDMTTKDINDLVDKLNTNIGVTPEQRKEMTLQSMFGWKDKVQESKNNEIEYLGSKAIVQRLKDYLEFKFGHLVSVQTVSVDGGAGIKITRKNKTTDLVELSDKIINVFRQLHLKETDWDVEMSGDNVVFALEPVSVRNNN